MLGVQSDLQTIYIYDETKLNELQSLTKEYNILSVLISDMQNMYNRIAELGGLIEKFWDIKSERRLQKLQIQIEELNKQYNDIIIIREYYNNIFTIQQQLAQIDIDITILQKEWKEYRTRNLPIMWQSI